MAVLKLSKADTRRAMALLHTKRGSLDDTVRRLKSVQFDPLQPAGCNHDLVLQVRVPGYKVGDWQKATYEDRLLYDGWDKQACLVPYEGWPVRRIFHKWHQPHFKRIFEDHPHAVEAVLQELEKRGPLLPKEFEFQERKAEWKGSWFGPNLTKQTLRALWHTGAVMTHSRRGQHHVYDLTERVLPPGILVSDPVDEAEAFKAILLDRHESVGIIRPVAPYEVWSMHAPAGKRRSALAELVAERKLIPVEVDGVTAHASRELIELLDSSQTPDRVVFFGPLDQLMWDRKMIGHLFDFEYFWEVYKPESQRRWGYYVLPVLYRDQFVARFDVWRREGQLVLKAWYWEPGQPEDPAFWPAFEEAMLSFMAYCGAKEVTAGAGADSTLKACLRKLKVR